MIYNVYMYEYWDYFLSLDDDLAVLGRYVELTPANFNTYSLEMVRILLAAGSEIDVVAKLLCQQVDPTQPSRNIEDYRAILTTKYPKFHTFSFSIRQTSTHLTPWSAWQGNQNPPWWRQYNNVKHERSTYYLQANLENTLHAVAGLFALVLYLYQPELTEAKIDPWPRILRLSSGMLYEPLTFSGGGRLPDF